MKVPNKIRNSRRWQLIREAARRKMPICANPFDLHGVRPTEDIHHIIPIAVDADLAYNTENLVGLCKECHAQITAIENKGRTTEHLFGKQYDGRGGIKSLDANVPHQMHTQRSNVRNVQGGGGCRRIEGDDGPEFWCVRMKGRVRMYCGSCDQVKGQLK